MKGSYRIYPTFLSASRRYPIDESAKIADDIISRSRPGVSALNAFPFSAAASPAVQGELTHTLARISATSKRLAVCREHP